MIANFQKTIELLDRQLYIDIPLNFEKIRDDSRTKDTMIAFANDEEIYLTFTGIQEESISLLDTISGIYTLLSGVQLGIDIQDMVKQEIEKGKSITIPFKSNNRGKKLYHVMRIQYISNSLLFFTAHCKIDVSKEWEPVFFNIFDSVRVKNEKIF